MKIAIEASVLLRKQKTGVAYYAQELTKALIKVAPNDEIDLVSLGSGKIDISGANVLKRRAVFFPYKLYRGLDHYLIPPPLDVLAGISPDIFVFPNFFHYPLWLCKRSIIVVHDLAFLETPQYLLSGHQAYLKRRIAQSIRRASRVITISEHTKKQIVQNYDFPADKIDVINPAIDHDKYQPAKQAEIEAVKKKYGITGKYLLFLGTMEPRKNVAGIVKAFADLPTKIKDDYQLVLAGGKGWLDEEIESAITALPDDRVVRTGYVDDADKPALYSGAALFLYPSNYEGWGMQILEAMACGTPVLTARNTSLTEAGGAAAAYVKDTSVEAICDAVSRLLGSNAKLAEMKKKGLAHAQNFSWEKSAKKLHQVLLALAENKS